MPSWFKHPSDASSTPTRRIPPLELVEEAKRFPDGWVYEIAGFYRPEDAVPPEAIKGAWTVDIYGRLTGEFTPNPRFVPNH